MGKIGEEVKSYIVKMDEIDEHGTLTRIVLPELNRLNILYPKEPNKKTFQETTELANLIYRFIARGPGVDVSPSYLGSYIKMAIVTVARPEKVFIEGTISHFNFIKYQLKDVESLLESAFEETRYFILLAGLEKNASERELLNIYIVENLLGGLIRPIVTLLNEQIPNERYMPDNWKKVLYAHRSGNLRLVPDEGGTQLSSD